MIHCFFLISRHGRSRLTKWYSHNLSQQEKQKFLKEVHSFFIHVRSINLYLPVNQKCATLLSTKITKLSIKDTLHFILSPLLIKTKINSLSWKWSTLLFKFSINILETSVNSILSLTSIRYNFYQIVRLTSFWMSFWSLDTFLSQIKIL